LANHKSNLCIDRGRTNAERILLYVVPFHATVVREDLKRELQDIDLEWGDQEFEAYVRENMETDESKTQTSSTFITTLIDRSSYYSSGHIPRNAAYHTYAA
jgi:hypothetical protein